MPLTLEWPEIALRLALTVATGLLIGINRTERGRAAGLRTTLLVCLAAFVSMIQTNLLMVTAGKTPDSFAVLDLMRVPLGILTGMGFIGSGAILRHGDRIQGVTTAATLWFVTVIGLCFGGGQNLLGLAALVLGLIVLSALNRWEDRLGQDHQATLTLWVGENGPTEGDIRAALRTAGFETASWGVAYTGPANARRRTLRCEVRCHGKRTHEPTPPVVNELAGRTGVLKLRWEG
jgi:putative Mg2+ transporter-C (MgtC) family protein